MVTGNEYVFNNVELALDYILKSETNVLVKDKARQTPHLIVRPNPGMFLSPAPDKIPFVPFDSLDYPLSAWFNNAADDKFVMTRLKSGRYSLKPNLRQRKYLFRGESEFHSPCKSNLSRNPKQKRFTGELAKGQEMELLMLSHPLVQLLDMGIELNGQTYCFEMNLFGLTQHYYNKTLFLDLTSNPRVAAFFATTKYDWDTDTYSPVEDDNLPNGVLYYYSLDIDHDFGVELNGNSSPLSTIGLQVFPRSGRQYGFLFNQRIQDDFNQVARANAVRFKHNAATARQIYDEFNGGDMLFPDDILMKHWKQTNRDKKVLSNRTVRMNQLFNSNMTISQIEQELKSLGYQIQDYIPMFTDNELDEYYQMIATSNYWEEFCNKIHIPGDTDGKMMKGLKNLPQNPNYSWAFTRDDSHITDYSKGYLLSRYANCLV